MRGIQKACYELEEGYQPAISFIVAVKRHHGRFNILSREDGVNCCLSFIFVFINLLQKQNERKKPKISETAKSGSCGIMKSFKIIIDI